jgi:hypothetical protein
MARDAQPEINPYAPSAIPEPLVRPVDRGIGVWRDGMEIVMHPQAELPRVCLVTGRPARYGYLVRIPWNRPYDVRARTLRLYVPLAAEVHHLCQRRRWSAIGGFATAAVVAGLAMYRHDLTGPAGISVALLALVIVGVAAFYFYVQYSQFLYFGSVEGDYLRLRGADLRFLDKLPEWQA